VSGSVSLEEGLAELVRRGVRLPAAIAAPLHAYLDLLQKWNQVYNLTAVRDPQRMITHHLLDSLAVLPYLDAARAGRVLDVGSGPGLPGIPIALARPDWVITLLDSNHKKGAFLQQAIAELALANAHVVVERVESFVATERYDVAISRAFSDLCTFAEAAVRQIRPSGRLVAMKGVFPHEELAQVPPGLKLVEAPSVLVPGLDAERHLVILEPA